MSKQISNFEKELKKGLSMKTPSGSSEEKQLLATFKYNDLQNKGRATFNDFLKILNKYSVHSYNPNELQAIFNHYDEFGEGTILYKEFIQSLFGHPISDSKSTTVVASSHNGMPFMPNEERKVDFAEMDKIIDLLLYKLSKKGMFGVLEFWVKCKNYDGNNEE